MANLFGRVAALSAKGRFALFAVLGVIAAVGQAPYDLWPATVCALAVVLALHQSCTTPRRAAFHAWGFGFGYFAFSLRWIVEPFLVDIARHGWMAPFALILMAGGAALFWAFAGYVAARLAPGRVLFFGLLLVGAEVTRSLILTGFPWALLGHVWITTPLAQLAAFGGPHLLTLLTVFAAWSLMLLATGRVLGGCTGLAGLAIAAFLAQPDPVEQAASDAPIVRLVQPNAPQHQKWDPAFRKLFVDRMIEMTGAGDVPDLVVWPETAIPFLLNHIQDDMSPLVDAARGAPLVFGIQRADELQQYRNSLVVMGSGGQVRSIYDKQHLVPFGEYVPGAALLGRAGATGLARNLGTGFTPGVDQGPVSLPGIGLAIPLICYEGIFAEEIGSDGDRARLLLLITNDAWFGKAAGPYQHLAQARLRAIEQGLPMVRVANTGVTAMIDAQGRITQMLPLGQEGAIDAALPPAEPETRYAQWGDMPVLVFLLALMVAQTAMQRRFSD